MRSVICLVVLGLVVGCNGMGTKGDTSPVEDDTDPIEFEDGDECTIKLRPGGGQLVVTIGYQFDGDESGSSKKSYKVYFKRNNLSKDVYVGTNSHELNHQERYTVDLIDFTDPTGTRESKIKSATDPQVELGTIDHDKPGDPHPSDFGVLVTSDGGEPWKFVAFITKGDNGVVVPIVIN